MFQKSTATDAPDLETDRGAAPSNATIVSVTVSGGYTTEPPQSQLTPLDFAFLGYGSAAKTQKGSVYAVTNLNASGAGSWAAGPSDAYIVFPNLSGDIVSPNVLEPASVDQWMLGQTSPNGIQFRGTTAPSTQPVFIGQGDDNIWTHVRFRAGDSPGGSQSSHSAFDVLGINGEQYRRMVLANCSFQFGDDNIFSMAGGITDMTIQDCISSHGLTGSNPSYPWFISQFNGTPRTAPDRISMFRNLLEGTARIPLIQNTGRTDFSNNITYTNNGHAYQTTATQTIPLQANHEKNLLIGVTTKSNHRVFYQHLGGAGIDTYLNDNLSILAGQTPSVNGTPITPGVLGGGPSPASAYARTSRHAFPDLELMEHDALLNHVLANAGASHNRDSLDQEVISAVQNGTAIPLNGTVAGFGGYPTMSPPPTPTQDIWDLTADDKISDAIKLANGLAPGSNTTQTFVNGGSSNDFLFLINKYFGL